jgi:NhaA family Na+:H+ antiporter
MSDECKTPAECTQLPEAIIDRLRVPAAYFLQIEAIAGAVLLFFTLAALLLANSPWAHPFMSFWEIPLGIQVGELDFVRSLREWINDALMTLFFFLVALELKRELVLGELRNPRMAALSIAAAVGGMVVPAGFYLFMQIGQPGEQGWGTVMATDTAFVIGSLALLGSRIPRSLRVFMLSLAIVDDIGAILVVAIGYSVHIAWWPLVMGVSGIIIVRAMAMIGVRSFPLYFLIGGLIWIAVDASGIHATVTGVILGLLTPARRWVSDERLYAILGEVIAHPDSEEGSHKTMDRSTLQVAEVAARETLSPLERLEIRLHPWVGFVIMPLFAFANAGVPFVSANFESSITLAVIVGFVLGKPLGVISFSWIAVRSGLAIRPQGLDWGMLAGGGLLAGIGFTMALFIANLAFSPAIVDEAKLGILIASVLSAVTGLLLLLFLSVHRRHSDGEESKVINNN